MAAAQAPTRDRIVEEAMRLFAEQGFRGTTVVQIESAAGLTPGAGGIYRHFKSKDAVLAEGVEHHLGRLDALRDIRGVFGDVGDLPAQLTVMARYVLAEIDREATLLSVAFSDPRHRPPILADAIDRLLTDSINRFAEWLSSQSAGSMRADRADALATLTLGGLLSTRLQRLALGLNHDIDDEILVATWVDLIVVALTTPAR